MLMKYRRRVKVMAAGFGMGLALVISGCDGLGGRPLGLPVEGARGILDVGDASGPEGDQIVDLAGAATTGSNLAVLTLDSPLDHSVFPPEIVAPDFRFHEPVKDVERWLIDVDLTPNRSRLYVLTDADPNRRVSIIDERCVTESNVYKPTARERSVKIWTPDETTWQAIKEASQERDITLTFFGMSKNLRRVVSRGRVSIRTSADVVGASLFYRDVPLMPSENVDGVVKPLAKGALPLIAWRLRDISQPESKIVMEGMPTCANCHSFSSDGSTIGMDMDGPTGDKGAYAITDVNPETVIEDDDVFSWNDFNPNGPPRLWGLGSCYGRAYRSTLELVSPLVVE